MAKRAKVEQFETGGGKVKRYALMEPATSRCAIAPGHADAKTQAGVGLASWPTEDHDLWGWRSSPCDVGPELRESWRRDMRTKSLGGVTGADGQIAYASPSGSIDVLTANGSPLWTYQPGPGNRTGAGSGEAPLLLRDHLIVRFAGRVMGFNRWTGEQVWQQVDTRGEGVNVGIIQEMRSHEHDFENGFLGLTPDGLLLVRSCLGSVIRTLDPFTGDLAMVRRIMNAGRAGPWLFGAIDPNEAQPFVPGEESENVRHAYAQHLATGEVHDVPMPGPRDHTIGLFAPMNLGDRALISRGEHGLVCADIASAAVHWRRAGTALRPQCCDGDGFLLVREGENDVLIALSAADGAEQWRAEGLGLRRYISLLVTPRFVFIASSSEYVNDVRLLAVDKATGEVAWTAGVEVASMTAGAFAFLSLIDSRLYLVLRTLKAGTNSQLICFEGKGGTGA